MLNRSRPRWLPHTGRVALLCAALAPGSVWLLSGGMLAKPMAALAWMIICAGLLAAIPSRRLRWSAWLQALALPWTLVWIATVAVTGMGPTNAMMEPATNGAFKVVLTGIKLAIGNRWFLLSAMLSVGALAWAFRATRKPQEQSGDGAAVLFLCLLIPLSAVALDGAQFLFFSRIMGPEARTAVPWLSHVTLVKESLSSRLFEAAYGEAGKGHYEVRNAAAATRQFVSFNGLGVLIIGESMRADAMPRDGASATGTALALRLRQGLGLRLPDACASSNSTFGSVPRLMTGVDVGDAGGAQHNPTVLALAKAAGARTAYINNHEIWVLPESGHDLLQKTSSMEVNAFDEVPVEAMNDFLKRSGPGPKAVVLHLFGQHLNYEDRYPARMYPAEPAALDDDALLELRYRRSADYTAAVLLQAAAILDAQKEPAFLVFTSDHAENLPSDKSGKHFHAGPATGKFDTTVPTLVLWNRAFADTGKPQMLDRLAKAKGLLAHRDVARAWLGLQGMPGELLPTADPMTWGALLPGTRFAPLSCATLLP
ncbi:MAG: sulfatase-like hydrolase/transferase [Pseudomonadota bacterium]